jgi:hypothetical protein
LFFIKIKILEYSYEKKALKKVLLQSTIEKMESIVMLTIGLENGS